MLYYHPKQNKIKKPWESKKITALLQEWKLLIETKIKILFWYREVKTLITFSQMERKVYVDDNQKLRDWTFDEMYQNNSYSRINTFLSLE